METLLPMQIPIPSPYSPTNDELFDWERFLREAFQKVNNMGVIGKHRVFNSETYTDTGKSLTQILGGDGVLHLITDVSVGDAAMTNTEVYSEYNNTLTADNITVSGIVRLRGINLSATSISIAANGVLFLENSNVTLSNSISLGSGASIYVRSGTVSNTQQVALITDGGNSNTFVYLKDATLKNNGDQKLLLLTGTSTKIYVDGSSFGTDNTTLSDAILQIMSSGAFVFIDHTTFNYANKTTSAERQIYFGQCSEVVLSSSKFFGVAPLSNGTMLTRVQISDCGVVKIRGCLFDEFNVRLSPTTPSFVGNAVVESSTFRMTRPSSYDFGMMLNPQATYEYINSGAHYVTIVNNCQFVNKTTGWMFGGVSVESTKSFIITNSTFVRCGIWVSSNYHYEGFVPSGLVVNNNVVDCLASAIRILFDGHVTVMNNVVRNEYKFSTAETSNSEFGRGLTLIQYMTGTTNTVTNTTEKACVWNIKNNFIEGYPYGVYVDQLITGSYAPVVRMLLENNKFVRCWYQFFAADTAEWENTYSDNHYFRGCGVYTPTIKSYANIHFLAKNNDMDYVYHPYFINGSLAVFACEGDDLRRCGLYDFRFIGNSSYRPTATIRNVSGLNYAGTGEIGALDGVSAYIVYGRRITFIDCLIKNITNAHQESNTQSLEFFRCIFFDGFDYSKTNPNIVKDSTLYLGTKGIHTFNINGITAAYNWKPENLSLWKSTSSNRDMFVAYQNAILGGYQITTSDYVYATVECRTPPGIGGNPPSTYTQPFHMGVTTILNGVPQNENVTVVVEYKSTSSSTWNTLTSFTVTGNGGVTYDSRWGAYAHPVWGHMNLRFRLQSNPTAGTIGIHSVRLQYLTWWGDIS